MTRPTPEHLRFLAERTDAIVAAGKYALPDGSYRDLRPYLDASLAETRLLRPEDWPRILDQAQQRCPTAGPRADISVTDETTLMALRRLISNHAHERVAALNFASARNPGGGYRRGAVAQEETLARASGLVVTLERCWDYYRINREQDSLLYTDHAIWSPQVPFFTDDGGALLSDPYRAGIITMPAPNNGAIRSEADTYAVPGILRRRIRMVLALAIMENVRHLVLGAWGRGAFGNHPEIVAACFRDALNDSEPWVRGFRSVTFAIYETSTRRPCRPAFEHHLTPVH